MIRILSLFPVILLCSILSANEPTLTSSERAKAIKLMQDSQTEFLEAVENLTDAAWTFKPAPERWSIAEVSEHIVLSEGLLFGVVEKALAADSNPDWDSKTGAKNEFLEKVMLNRTGKAQAPEQIQPKGKMTRAEIISRYKEGRAKTLKFTEETQLPMKEHTFEHPLPIFNTLNAYQWLIYIPLHNMRHDQQIAEVKASPNFPK